MRRVLLMLILVLLCGTSFAGPGDELWIYAVSTLSFSTMFRECNYPVAVDRDGSTVVGATDKVLTANSTAFTGYVKKIDRDGNLLWEEKLTPDHQYSLTLGVALDGKDNVIASGAFMEAGNLEGKVVSFSPDGERKWEKTINLGTGASLSALLDIAADISGNVALCGAYYSSSGESVGRVILLSSTGDMLWDKRVNGVAPAGGKAEAFLLSVAFDGNGNVVAGGFLSNSAGTNDLYVVSYSHDGTKLWEKKGLTAAVGEIYKVAVDSNNNAVAVGCVNQGPSGEDWYVVSYSPSGSENWHAVYDSGKGNDSVVNMVITARNDVVVTGFKALSKSFESYVIAYSSSGAKLWESSTSMWSGTDFSAQCVAVDGNDNVVVGGDYSVTNSSNPNHYLISFSPSGGVNWSSSKTSLGIYGLAVDVRTGTVVTVVRNQGTGSYLHDEVVAHEGYSSNSRLFKVGDFREYNPAPENPSVADGAYLGFGSVVNGGDTFKIEAHFPKPIQQSKGSVKTTPTKIFLAAAIPGYYDHLLVFKEDGTIAAAPPNNLSPWRRGVTTSISDMIIPEVKVEDLKLPSGIYYWFSLTVPDDIPDDLGGIDWENTPWDLTLSVFEVQ